MKAVVLKKILLLGFFISAAFITYAITMTFGTLHITDDRFTTEDRDYLTVVGKHISVEDYEKYFTPQCEVFFAEQSEILCNSVEVSTGGDYGYDDDYEEEM